VRTNHFVQIEQSSEGSLEKIEHLATGPLHFAPGSRWEYSNTNYIALGRVIDRNGETNAAARRDLLSNHGGDAVGG
jgi:CubicO group peptidase (beta-lactamase class C family)